MKPACFPRLRWAAAGFLAVYLPAYTLAYGIANFSFVDPILKRSWGGPLVHVSVVAGFLVLVAYPLSYLVLLRLLPQDSALGRSALPPAGRTLSR